MINAKIIADSKNTYGDRITTMLITFPRFILAELNTHRMFSRNSASSRAIPFEKMLKSVQENPFVPIAWQKDHKGMQGTEYITDSKSIERLEAEWKTAVLNTVKQAQRLNSGIVCRETWEEGFKEKYGVTKQLCNRLLEPFMWHTVLITATEWENFFELRCPQYWLPNSRFFDGQLFRSRKNVLKTLKNHGEYQRTVDFLEKKATDIDWLKTNKGAAEIHMMAFAEAMYDAYNEGTPKLLQPGEWHIPFGDNIDLDTHVENVPNKLVGCPKSGYTMTYNTDENKIKIATARCARVSYTVTGEEERSPNYENDLKLHDRLAKSGHWSPFEHCAKAMDKQEYENLITTTYDVKNDVARIVKGTLANFKGFIAYRHTIKANM